MGVPTVCRAQSWAHFTFVRGLRAEKACGFASEPVGEAVLSMGSVLVSVYSAFTTWELSPQGFALIKRPYDVMCDGGSGAEVTYVNL